MQVAQGQQDGFNRKNFLVIRSVRFGDVSIIKQLDSVYTLERDFVAQVKDWQVAYLFFVEWHKN